MTVALITWEKLPACRAASDGLEAYPTYDFDQSLMGLQAVASQHDCCVTEVNLLHHPSVVDRGQSSEIETLRCTRRIDI